MKQTPIKVETRTQRNEVRVAQGDGNTLVGYIAVYNSPSEDMGGYTEILAPGCFTRTLTDKDYDIVAIINHDDDAPVGRISAGTMRLASDDTGLKYEIDLPQTTRANDLKISIERKDVTGCSFGFVCNQDQWVANEDGSVLRIIQDVDLVEVSVGVTFPAYTDTSSQLRNLPASIPLEFRSQIEKRAEPSNALAAVHDNWKLDTELRIRLAEAS